MTITTLGNIIYYWNFFFSGCNCREGKDCFGTTCTVIKCKQRLYVMYRIGLDMD